MKTTSSFALTAFFYFTIAICTPAVQAQDQVQAQVQAQVQVPFRLVHDTFAVVSIQINGQGPFDFLLDTGTDTTIVDQELAARLALVPIDRMTLTTPGGRQVLTRSRLRSLVLGPAALPDVEVLVQDISSLRQLDSRIRGIVGLNFFSHFNFLLDYRQRNLRFESANELRDSTRGEHVLFSGGTGVGQKMLVESEIRSGDTTRALLLLDSGVNEMVLFRQADYSQLLPSGMRLTVAGPSSKPQNMNVGRIETLRIGKQRFHDLRCAFSLAAHADGRPDDVYPGSVRREDGLLPTALFRALYINNREGFVVFNPKFDKS